MFLLSCVALLASSCVVREEAGYRSGPYGASYDCYYYPDCEVYYYPVGGVYFWCSDGHWVSGRRLPSTVVLNNTSRVNVRLNTSRPYTQHEWVRRQYPFHPGS